MSGIIWDDADLKKALSDLITKTPEKAKECMGKACAKIQGDAAANCPKETGELRRSIQSEVKEEGGNIIGIVGTNLDYAPYVHEGTGIMSRTGAGRKEVPWTYYNERTGQFVKTSGIKSTPFLEDAYKANAASIAEYFREVVSDA